MVQKFVPHRTEDPLHHGGRNCHRRATRVRRRIELGLRCAVLTSPLLVLLISTPALGERVPLRTFTPADGLPSEGVNTVLADRNGYLWIGCDDGLSQFDGRQFRNYGVADGLIHPAVTRLLETRAGVYWVGTLGGLCRFDPGGGVDTEMVLDIGASPVMAAAGRPRFDCALLGDSTGAASITSLAEERSGRLWIGTADGLFVLEGGHPSEARPVELPVRWPDTWWLQVNGLVDDGEGGLWIGTDAGLVHRLPDGRMRQHPLPADTNGKGIRELLRDRSGLIWVGMDDAVYVFRPRRGDGRAGSEPADVPIAGSRGALRLPAVEGQGSLFTTGDGLPSGWYRGLLEDRDGHIWLGADALVEIEDGSVRTYGLAQGLKDPTVFGLTEDLWGNLWIATEAGGLVRLYQDGFTTYGVQDGLGTDRIGAILESRRGELCVLSSRRGDYLILNTPVDRGFVSVRPAFPRGLKHGSWGWNQVVVQDLDGDWWISTGEGLVRFPPVARLQDLATARPRAWYHTRDGLPADEIFRLFGDSRGDIWIGTVSPGRPTLGRWERATGRFHVYDLRQNPGGFASEAPSAFREDRAGNLWIGFGAGGLLRYRRGRFESFPPGAGIPEGRVLDLHLDGLGRLWVATSKGGAARCDDPAALSPRFRAFTTADGLASDRVTCITEDRWGRIYLGTARGINRLDPATGAMRRLTTDDGLARDHVVVAFRDSRDDLWFGTRRGLSRLRPRPDPEEPAPVVRITDLAIAGRRYPLPDLGLREIRGLRIQPGDARVQIGFAAPGFAPGGTVRYQYRLGSGPGDWGAPFTERSVQLAGLAPGRYRFELRATTDRGTASVRPAVMSFVVLAPLWQRGWFLALALTVIAGALAGLHRMRVSRLLGLELQRTRIAMDLHDELGSGLGSIAVLSDLAAGDSIDADRRRGLVRQIEDTAVEMVHSLTGIVRTLRPGEATLEALAHDLAERGRRMFPGTGATLTIDYPSRWPRATLSLAVRRNVMLIGVEALHNAARHADACRVVLRLSPVGRRWRLGVRDDGRGMGEARSDGPHRGLGLESMRRRAEEIGAALCVESTPGGGTEVVLLFDLRAEDHRLRRR